MIMWIALARGSWKIAAIHHRNISNWSTHDLRPIGNSWCCSWWKPSSPRLKAHLPWESSWLRVEDLQSLNLGFVGEICQGPWNYLANLCWKVSPPISDGRLYVVSSFAINLFWSSLFYDRLDSVSKGRFLTSTDLCDQSLFSSVPPSWVVLVGSCWI